MKVFLLSVIFILCLAAVINAGDFRDVNWGMSPAEVLENETAGGFLELETGEYSYETRVAGFDAYLFYIFVNTQLAEAEYIFLNKHTNDNVYIEDYHQIKNLLMQKYGQPESDDLLWKDDTYKDNENKYGTAVAMGDLEYTTKWVTESTIIDCWLYGDNFEVTLGITYYSTDLYELLQEEEREQAMNAL